MHWMLSTLVFYHFYHQMNAHPNEDCQVLDVYAGSKWFIVYTLTTYHAKIKIYLLLWLQHAIYAHRQHTIIRI